MTEDNFDEIKYRNTKNLENFVKKKGYFKGMRNLMFGLCFYSGLFGLERGGEFYLDYRDSNSWENIELSLKLGDFDKTTYSVEDIEDYVKSKIESSKSRANQNLTYALTCGLVFSFFVGKYKEYKENVDICKYFENTLGMNENE